tara:strand:- start:11449 stop:16440 length:4992 start_codon:yes stop_codon:yes gene_type:complete
LGLLFDSIFQSDKDKKTRLFDSLNLSTAADSVDARPSRLFDTLNIPKQKPELFNNFDPTATNIAGEPIDAKKMPSGFFDATLEGFGSMGLFIEPDVPFSELQGFRRKAGRVVGGVGGMVSVHVGLNALTGGGGTLGALALSGSKTGLKTLSTAGKIWKAGEKSLALSTAGFGTTYTSRFGLKLINNKTVDKFFNLAADNPEEALKLFGRRQTAKEVGIFTGYGQISATAKQLNSDEEFDIKKNLKALPFDALAGGIFSRAGLQSMRYQSTAKKIATRATGGFAAGFTSGALNSSEATFSERFVSGLAMGAFGPLSVGTTLQVTRNQLGLSLRKYGDIGDEEQINQLSKFALVKAEEVFNKMSIQYAGTKYNSKSGAYAILKKIDYDPETKTYKAFYDTFNKKGKQTNVNKKGEFVLKKKDIDDFYATYTNTPDEVTRIKANVDKKGNKKSFFKTDKDLKTFSENKSWGIFSAVNGGYKFHLPIKPGENAEDALIREILALGYKESDIMKISTNSSMKNVFNSFIVKNIKDKDAITLGRLTGQQYVKTNKGLIELVRKAGTNDLALDKVLYHSRVAGSTTIGETILRGGVTKSRAKTTIVKGVPIKIRSKSSRPAKGGEKFTVANPAKFKDIDIEMVELEGGRVVAFGSEYAVNKITKNARYPSKLKNELDFMELIGASRLKNVDEVTLGLQRQVRAVEKSMGMRDSKGGGAHRSLKLLLFNKTKTTQLTADEITTYNGILSGLDSDEILASKFATGVKSIDDVLNAETINPAYFSSLKMLPLYRRYDTLYKVTGLETFKNFRDRMIRREFFSEGVKASIFDMRMEQEAIRKKIRGAGLRGLPQKDFDEIIFGLIDPKFSWKLKPYDKKIIEQVKEAAKLHKDVLKQIDDLAIELGVPVTKYVNGKRKPVKWISEKNYMPLTVKSDFFDLTNRNEFVQIQVLKQLSIQYPGLDEQALKDLFIRLGKNTERNGIFGVQYSRTFDLDPIYFLDDTGKVMKVTSSDDFVKKVGDSIEGVKIAKRIEVYEYNYANTMDRYAGRIANILSLAKYFGKDTEFKTIGGQSGRLLSGYRTYGTYFNKAFKEIELFAQANKNKLQGIDAGDLIDMMKNDADYLIRSDQNTIGSRIAGGFTNIAATLGLSGVISPIKNLLLGNTQTFTTFNSFRFFEVLSKTVGSTFFRQAYLTNIRKMTRQAGGFSGGKQILETTFSDTTPSRAATFLMTKAEMFNRLIAVPTGKLTADDALKTLLNKNARATDKQKAASFLRDTMMLGDEYAEAVTRGEFSDEQLQMILVRSHQTTQGLATKPFIPPFFNQKYVKPFTLFTRIATVVTDNVFNNVIKPVRDGNPFPLVKYTIGTGLTGYAVAETIHWLYNQPARVFNSIPEEITYYLAYGEFLGALGIAYDIFDSMTDATKNPFDTFAVSRTGLALAYLAFQGPKAAVQYVRNNDDVGSAVKQDIRNLELLETAASTSALTNNIYKISERITRPVYQDYQNNLSLQRDFRTQYGLQSTRRPNYNNQEEEDRNAVSHKQYLKVLFYSDADPQQFINAARATANAVAMKNIYNQGNATSPKLEYDAAVKEVLQYIEKDLNPVILGKELSRGRLQSEYDTFKNELKQKDPKAYEKHIKGVEFFDNRLIEIQKFKGKNGLGLYNVLYNDMGNYELK